jgi:hypothetical protein
MKKISLVFSLIVISLIGYSQVATKSTQPEQLSLKDQELLLSLPDLLMPDAYKSKTIPYKIDHSQSEHFRPMFVQSGMSCGQASSTGICFTYEMNAARNLPANTNANLYPTGFVYNWDAGDYGGNGVSYYQTLEVLRQVGTPDQAEYGGTIDAGGNLRWITGYDLYYNTMQNRISGAFKIDVGHAEGLQILKNWMNDHLNGDIDGGCAIFYSTVPSPTGILPAGTEEGGKQVITVLSASTSHSMAILGYNDSIRYDYNNDGQYTNNLDITGDGTVDMRDWEMGGIKMCNTYSGGPAWADGGFCYIMYKALATGAFWHDMVHVMKVNPDYSPLLTAKANITYTNRKRIKIYAGISTNLSATEPEYVIDLPIFDYQGGETFMKGGTAEADKTLEFGLDLTTLLNYIDPNQAAKYFLQVYESDAEGWGTGTVNSFSIINYSSGSPVETASTQTNVAIVHNGITTLSLTSSENYDPVEITSTELPSGAIMSPYSQQLEATGGTEPYSWSFNKDFTITQATTTFPSGGTALSGSGFFAVPLGFTFKYYGVDYSTIYVSSKGLVVFESGFSDYFPYYNHDETVFMHTKSIAPFYQSTITSTMKSISGSGYKTIIWDNSTIDFAMTIYETGEINFVYTNSVLTSLTQSVIGVSNGDEVNVQRLAFDNPNSVSTGFTYDMVPFIHPVDFQVSTDGLLTGVPMQEYLAENFHFKVVDNNGLIDRISLPFVTEGLILNYAVSTPDDNVIEYSETATIDLTATNPMDYAVTGITITASITDPYITVVNNSVSCPDLNPSIVATLTDAFSFDVSSNVPDNYSFQMNFNVVSDQGTWLYFYNFTAFAPNIISGTVVVDDGNDNILAPDETADILIPINNIGGSDVHNLSITASTTDPYITLNTTSQNITSLEPEQIENISFNLTSAAIVENQHVAQIVLTITADNGFTEEILVDVTINTAIIVVTSTLVNDGLNNCLDPGESSDVLFNLQNIGFVAAHNITATLTTADPFVTVNTGPELIANLLAGNNSVLTYNLTVDASCSMAHLVELNLNIIADNGLSTDLTVYLIVGILQENFESGGLESFEWTSGGNAEWYPVTDIVYEGTYSLKSGNINDEQQSTLSIDMFVVADGEISFMRKVSSENYYDFLEFLVDGLVVVSWSGEMPWTEYSYNVVAGQHNFMWRYRKDINAIGGSDAAWIDNITFPAVNNIPPILSCDVTPILKTMNTNQEDSDPFMISNIGGGVVDFNVTVVPVGEGFKSIEGSTVTSSLSSFEPGQSYDVTFSINALSPDMEWIKTVKLNFPAEVTVNSSTDFVGPSGSLLTDGTTGSGVELIWATTETWGTIHENETATCTVNITFAEPFTALTSEILYTIIGDTYGAEPHQIESNISLTNESSFWLSVNPVSGAIPFDSDFELTLNYNTTGMVQGVYHANVIIADASSTYTVPVELTVDFTSELIDIQASSNFQCYPNPFRNNINLTYTSLNDGIASLKLYDITGKLIEVLESNHRIMPGKNSFSYSLDNNLSSGMYVIKLETSSEVVFGKIIKE